MFSKNTEKILDGLQNPTWNVPISYPEMVKLMDEYNLTIDDMPAFPPRDTDFRKLIIAIGEAKK